MSDSFLFYRDYIAIARRFPPDKRLEFLEAICDYGLEDSAELKSDDFTIDTVFVMVKSLLDANRKNRENGSRGGRPKKGGFENQKGGFSNKKPGFSNQKPNVNVNDNVNANDNENWNVNDNDNSNVNGNVNENLKGSRPTSDSPLSEDGLTDEDRAAGWMYMR